MDKKLLRQYRDTKAKKKALEDKEKELKDRILDSMQKEDTEKLETGYGTFTIARRPKWHYSEAVDKLNEKLKLAKVKEEQKGVAEKEVIHYLVFTESKE